MNDPIKEESKLTYDDRKKVLIQEKKQVMENTKTIKSKSGDGEEEQLFSTVESSMKVTYEEPGIRLAYEGLKGREANLKAVILNTEEDIKNLGESIDKSELPEMPEDLKELKTKLEELQKYQKLDKQKDDLEKKKEDLKEMQDDLKKTAKDIKEIQDTIGSRLKL